MKGFTLIEILVVILILAGITAFTFPNLLPFREKNLLENSVEEVMNILRLAQSNSTASKQDKVWGVSFSKSEYILFKKESIEEENGEEKEKYALPSSLEFRWENDNTEMVFSKITGGVSEESNEYIEITTKDQERRKRICVENYLIFQCDPQ